MHGFIKKAFRLFNQEFAQNRNRKKLSSSQKYLQSLKQKYEGRRGFVIGNGPSLYLSDLEMIKNDVSIASNKIYLAFEKVDWRPTLYTIVDRIVWDKIYSLLPTMNLIPIIPSYLPPKAIPHYTVKCLGNAVDLFLQYGSDYFSNDACIGLYGGYSVTYENLQIAFHLGLNPIYIIGCDHYYRGEPRSIVPEKPIETMSTGNHFIECYRNVGEKVNPAPIEKMTIAYEIANRVAKDSGKMVINATRGGHLEAFPRLDFESLFN